MRSSDRPRRRPADRQTPNRRPGMATGGSSGGANGTGGSGGTQGQAALGSKTIEQVVAETLHKGYGVVEDNLRQSRHAAQRLRRGTYEPSEIPAELGKFANRLLQLGMELGAPWVELTAAMLRDQQLRFAFEEAGQEALRTAEAVQPVSPRIVYRIRCSREVEHLLTLHPLRRPTVPAIAGLYSIAPNAPPIPAERVTFRPNPEDGSLLVHINVPEDTPAGIYS